MRVKTCTRIDTFAEGITVVSRLTGKSFLWRFAIFFLCNWTCKSFQFCWFVMCCFLSTCFRSAFSRYFPLKAGRYAVPPAPTTLAEKGRTLRLVRFRRNLRAVVYFQKTNFFLLLKSDMCILFLDTQTNRRTEIDTRTKLRFCFVFKLRYNSKS